jgi:hypothetical protein
MILDVWQPRDLQTHFLDVWQGKDLVLEAQRSVRKQMRNACGLFFCRLGKLGETDFKSNVFVSVATK